MISSQMTGSLGNVAALRLFEHLAQSTWGWLDDARRLNLGFSEDTISDLTQLEIARSATNGVVVRRVTKRDERLVGFDWLWVISRPGRSPAIYVIQAKKLKLDNSNAYSYGRLKYKAGSRYQLDALDCFAKWLDAKPMYCFYNNVDDPTAQTHWNCRVQQTPDVPQMGCTLVPLDEIRPIHDSRAPKNFVTVHQNPKARPWRCLFHPQCDGFSMDDKSTRRSEVSNRSGRGRALEFLSELSPDDEGQIDWEEAGSPT